MRAEDDRDVPVEPTIDEATAAAERASRATEETLDAMRAAAADAAARGAEAVSSASATFESVTEDALDDAEDLAEDAAAWLDEKYRENPTLVIAVAAAAGLALLIGVGAIIRAVLRR